MEDIIFSEATKQGIWALLFISLFIYQLQDSRRREEESKEREDKLQIFINQMGESLKKLVIQYEKIAECIEDIKDKTLNYSEKR